jgi:hypothetical protein
LEGDETYMKAEKKIKEKGRYIYIYRERERERERERWLEIKKERETWRTKEKLETLICKGKVSIHFSW